MFVIWLVIPNREKKAKNAIRQKNKPKVYIPLYSYITIMENISLKRIEGPEGTLRNEGVYYFTDDITKQLEERYDSSYFGQGNAPDGRVRDVITGEANEEGELRIFLDAAQRVGHFLGFNPDGYKKFMLSNHGSSFVPTETEFSKLVKSKYLRAVPHGDSIVYFPTEQTLECANLNRIQSD